MNELDSVLAAEGVAITDQGVQLQRCDWMTDADWDYVQTAMTNWWDGYWAGFTHGRVGGPRRPCKTLP